MSTTTSVFLFAVTCSNVLHGSPKFLNLLNIKPTKSNSALNVHYSVTWVLEGSSSRIPNLHSHGNNNTNLCIGPSNLVCVLVLLPAFESLECPMKSVTFHTKPFSFSSAFIPRANDQRFLGASSSLIKTTSLAWKFLLGRCHLCHFYNESINSFLQRVQNSLLKWWTRLHRFRKYLLAVWNTPGGGRAILLFILRNDSAWTAPAIEENSSCGRWEGDC